MPAKKPDPTPAPELTPAERRAQKIARFHARHAARSQRDVSNYLPCGPSGGYEIVNAPASNDAEIVTHVQA